VINNPFGSFTAAPPDLLVTLLPLRPIHQTVAAGSTIRELRE
jgi:hypothetical protein